MPRDLFGSTSSDSLPVERGHLTQPRYSKVTGFWKRRNNLGANKDSTFFNIHADASFIYCQGLINTRTLLMIKNGKVEIG